MDRKTTFHRYFVRISYLGENFYGWQKEREEDPTIEGSIQDALETILRFPCPIIGCGRTDAGVHAKNYIFHFDSEAEVDLIIKKNLNGILDDRIVVHDIREVQPDSHARFSAISRQYEYRLLAERNPFLRSTTFVLNEFNKLDLSLLHKSAEIIKNYEDFTTFCKSDTDVATKLCQIHESQWLEKEGELIYRIQANRFLRGMVRLIVGMCLSVALGKIELDEVEQALKSKQILSKNWSVPAHGLMLKNIEYEKNIYLTTKEYNG